MTDEQIIKALECCCSPSLNKCDSCLLDKECGNSVDEPLLNYALDLIKRQKAEIKKLQDKIHKMFEYKVEVSYDRA